MQKQYQKMINDALDPEYDPPTKVSDLVGFWELIVIQTEQADKEYDKILRLKNSNWVVKEDTKDSGEMAVPKRSKNVLKPVNKPIKSRINTEQDKARKEKLKAIKEAMKVKKLVPFSNKILLLHCPYNSERLLGYCVTQRAFCRTEIFLWVC